MEFLASWWTFMSTRLDQIQESTLEHSLYVVSVLGLASVFSIALGVLTRRSVLARELSLAITSVFLTLPALALFTIFIPLVGLGFAPSFIALFLYSLLPILRNTITGLDGIDSSVLDAAKGMGLTSRQVLLRIQLPLAWPVILAGIRVSSMLIVGVAAIATLVAGGGLGDFIKSGLARLPLPNSLEAIWTGTLLCLVLALIIDLILQATKRATISRGIR
ncbi:MAG: ABC transporter permease [Microbacteriaceae bacterium]|jgi:osmoprotectant transport system permease protein|nr:ABC transporter permease [Pontimonas sp.]MBT4909181.1 ABC transporter permease [Microbacteriaceae bacterium]MBT5248100.1 ABC transporter permease [Microbacteriaceae bacterium]MBT5616622.1 ABC transporter permease [Microbacteriaceae bacterium]MDA9117081.1 ABC transporter permease [Pontimonas sp.]